MTYEDFKKELDILFEEKKLNQFFCKEGFEEICETAWKAFGRMLINNNLRVVRNIINNKKQLEKIYKKVK